MNDAVVFKVPVPLDLNSILSKSWDVGADPNALSLFILNVPAANIFEPVWVLVPDKTKIPAPSLVIVPDPAITPA